MADVFAVQDEISAAIVSAMKLALAPRSDVPRYQPSLPAYEAYLRYRSHQWSFTPESLQRSRECLEQAIELDPRFALPIAGLADHYAALADIGAISAHDGMLRARELALRALELDPTLPEAHGMLGIVAGPYELNWPEAARRHAVASSKPPVPWHVRCWYAMFYLLPLGRGEETLRESELVLQENPLDQMMQANVAAALDYLGEEEQAISIYQRACKSGPHFWWGWFGLGMLHARHGRDHEARQCAEQVAVAGDASPYTLALPAGTLMNDGETARAEELLAKLRAHPHGANTGLTCYHLVRRDFDQAVQCALKAVDERLPSLIYLVVRPNERALRQSPAWPTLLKRLNLAEPQ
jgi:tetratricopeptide (TPR) repeat protein